MRLLSLFQRLCLSFYSNMALVLFCTIVRVRGRVGTTVLFQSRKDAARLSECVAVVEVARLNSENVSREKKRNSLKLSGDRLHACGDVTSCCCCSTAGRASATAGRASAKELATGQETGQVT